MILTDELKWRKLKVLRLEENCDSIEFEPMPLRSSTDFDLRNFRLTGQFSQQRAGEWVEVS